MGQLIKILKEITIKSNNINFEQIEDLFSKIQSSNKSKAGRMAGEIYMKYFNKYNIGWAANWEWVDKLLFIDKQNFYKELLHIKNKFKIE